MEVTPLANSPLTKDFGEPTSNSTSIDESNTRPAS